MKILAKKVFINFLKGIILLFLLVMLVSEAFLTAHFMEPDIIVVYTAVITTLCCLLFVLFFIAYSKFLYLILFIFISIFLYLYYFDSKISLAHQQERCLDLGKVWDKEQNKC